MSKRPKRLGAIKQPIRRKLTKMQELDAHVQHKAQEFVAFKAEPDDDVTGFELYKNGLIVATYPGKGPHVTKILTSDWRRLGYRLKAVRGQTTGGLVVAKR